jgi:hypothetical protein
MSQTPRTAPAPVQLTARIVAALLVVAGGWLFIVAAFHAGPAAVLLVTAVLWTIATVAAVRSTRI